MNNNPHSGKKILKFLSDQTYSLVPTAKLDSIGQNEVDQKRKKGDSKGYAEMENVPKVNSTKPQDASEVENDAFTIRDE